jgi:hypothetical protein
MLVRFPKKPVPRTAINTPALEQKAIAFLDKNYTRLKATDKIGNVIYMLEPKSINGIKRIGSLASQRTQVSPTVTTIKRPVIEYTIINKYGKEEVISENFDITITDKDIKWYRLFGTGTSAIDAVFGGKSRNKSRNKSRRKSRNKSRRKSSY